MEPSPQPTRDLARILEPETLAVSAGRPHSPGDPLNAPITMASAFRPGGGLEYARFDNPAFDALQDVVGTLEGGRALAFASGNAAAAAVFSLVPHGSTIVLPRHGYNGTGMLAEQAGFEVRWINPADTDECLAAFDGAALVWLESPTNPAMEVGDLAVLVPAAKAAGALVSVDNTFRTPLRERPLEYGADIVTHSVSKLLAGHSDVVLGIAITGDDELYGRLHQHCALHGAVPGALECYLAARGVRTLSVRLDKAEATADMLAARLGAHAGVSEVRHPGFGTMICFVVDGDDGRVAQTVTESSQLITLATSLGGVESTWERRRRHAAEPDTIPAGLIRLSVGIEHPEDLWNDIAAALEAAGAGA